jgi:hypothetical protein
MGDLNLQHAYYELKSSGVPDNLTLDQSVKDLINMRLPPLDNFALELNAITRYSDLKRQSSYNAKDEKNSGDTADVNAVSVMLDTAHIADAKPLPIATTISTGNSVTNPTDAKPGPEAINKMMDRCSASRDIAQFYLEATGWNLDSAVSMYNENKQLH